MKRKQTKYESQINAVKEANIGKTLSKKHKAKIQNTRKQLPKNYSIVATENSTGKTMTFKSQAECARYLGVSRQMVGQCLHRPEIFKNCRDWKITLIVK